MATTNLIAVGVITLVLLVGTSWSVNPGVTLTLSQSGLNYAAGMAIDQLASDVQGQSLPDQHGSSGKVSYDLTGMRITSFTRPSSSLAVNPGHGITWSLSGAAASLHGNWRYKLKKGFIKISDHGNFDVTVSGVTTQVAITMAVDQNGRPTIAMTSCSCGIGNVRVKLHGGASWLYNLLSKLLKEPIERKLKELMCNSIQKAINVDAAKALAQMKVKVPIEHVLTLDYRLVAPPVFGNGYLESDHKGEFLWAGSPKEVPFQPDPMTKPGSTQKMVTICLSDYVMNTLGYVMHTRGLLNYTLTKNDLPTEDRGYLDTHCAKGTCVGSFMPQLAKMFPNGSVELGMQTTAAPTMTTSDKQTTGDFQGYIVFNVRLPDGALKHAFTSNLVTTIPMEVTMNGDKLTAKVNAFRFKVTKTQSDIGNIPAPLQTFIFNFAAKKFILPKLNDIGQKGIIIPGIDHVAFIEPQLLMLKGGLCFRTDAKYDPTLRFKPHQ